MSHAQGYACVNARQDKFCHIVLVDTDGVLKNCTVGTVTDSANGLAWTVVVNNGTNKQDISFNPNFTRMTVRLKCTTGIKKTATDPPDTGSITITLQSCGTPPSVDPVQACYVNDPNEP